MLAGKRPFRVDKPLGVETMGFPRCERLNEDVGLAFSLAMVSTFAKLKISIADKYIGCS